jgi:signal transduction histidine kinase
MNHVGVLTRRVLPGRWSLRLRITLGVTLALASLIAGFMAIHYWELRQQMLQSSEMNLTALGRVIEGSLEHTMLTQDRDELQRIMDKAAQQPEIRFMVLLNRQSEVRFAPHDQGVGTHLDMNAPGCEVCHRAQEPERGSVILLTTPQGEPVLRYCIPIQNQVACQGCHDPNQRINGALIADFSLAATQNDLNNELFGDMLAGAGLIIASAFIVNLLLDRLILNKLDRTLEAIRRFGRGDYAQRVAPQGADEIGQVAAAFNDMAQGLQAKEQETTQLYQELQRKETARAQLLQRIIAVQEEERKRIARELHDDFAQTLTALTLSLETAVQALPNGAAHLKEQLIYARDLTTTTLGQTYDWIQDLRPQVLDDLGLVAAIRWYADTRLASNGIEVELSFSHFHWRLPSELETTLFRVIQETINNIAKHASARRVRIQLQVDGARVIAEIEDDGVGFDSQAFLNVPGDMRGIGLLGMQERVALVGGTLALDSRPGAGTRVRIETPWTA